MKLVVSHNVIPRALVLRGVEVSSHQQHGCGAFGDVFQGRLGTCKIAVKKLRVSEIHQEEAKKVVSSRHGVLASALTPGDYRH